MILDVHIPMTACGRKLTVVLTQYGGIYFEQTETF
jgi:hypothetical protein